MSTIELIEVRTIEDRAGAPAIAEFSVHHADGARDSLQVVVVDPPAQPDDQRAAAWVALSARLKRYGRLAPVSDAGIA